MIKKLKSEPQPVPTFTMSGPGDVRNGPLMATPSVLTELSVSLSRAFAQAGVDPRLFDHPDNRISLEDVGTLFDTCVALTGCHHFGLLVGQRFALESFGPLMRNCSTAGGALRSPLPHFTFTSATRRQCFLLANRLASFWAIRSIATVCRRSRKSWMQGLP